MSGVLSDRSIRELVERGGLIHPFNPAHLGPAGYDVMLAQSVCLGPGDTLLASSQEYFHMPDDLLGELFGRSSLARQFVMAHVVSGPLEPGWYGEITFELVNLGHESRSYNVGDRIAQVKFSWLDQPAERPYHGRYNGQRGPTQSRFEHGED